MRLILLVVLLLVIGCSAVPDSEPLGTSNAEEPRRRVAATMPPPDVLVIDDGDPEPELGERITIAGALVTDRDEPIAGRRFVTVGHDRDRRAGITGPGGAIAVEGVAPPYDLLVQGSPDNGPTVYLGLTSPDPYIALLERDGVTVAAPSQTIRVGIRAPSCGRERCIVDVMSASRSGDGNASTLSEPTADDDAIAIVEVSHVWWAAKPAEGEKIAIHALVHDVENRTFAYGSVAGIEPAPGEMRDTGLLRATALATTAPLTPGGVMSSVAADALWSTLITLDVPGASGAPGPAFALAAATASAVTTRLPILAGASWRVMVTAMTPGRASTAWSGSCDVGDGAPRLELPPAPSDVAIEDGRLRWRAGASALAIIDVVDVARASHRYRIVTNETDVALGRLEDLGLRGLEKGAHELALTIAPDVSLNETVDPDPAVRSRQRDVRRAGVASYARVAVDVIP